MVLDFTMFLLSVFVMLFVLFFALGVFVLPLLNLDPILVIPLLVGLFCGLWFWVMRKDF